MDITFQENAGQGLGTLLINGLEISHNNRYDPFGKIWASVRKRIRERWHVDVVGLFTYNDDKKIISCTFCLNYCAVEMQQVEAKIYTARYADSFPRQMTFFEDVVLAFVGDTEHGLAAYEKLYQENPTKRELDQLLNQFLCSISVRTPKEQRKSDRRHAQKANQDRI